MNCFPHVASVESRGFEIVNMETVPTLSGPIEFPCLAEPLAPESVGDLAFRLEAPKLRLSWPPIDGVTLENGDRINFMGVDYQVKMIFADILRDSDPYFSGVLCGGLE